MVLNVKLPIPNWKITFKLSFLITYSKEIRHRELHNAFLTHSTHLHYVRASCLSASLSLSHIHWSSFTNENVWPDLGPRTIGYPGTNIFWPAINHGAPGWSASVHTYGRDPRGASFKKKKRKRSVHPPVVIVHDEKWPSNVSTRVVVWMVRSRHSPVLFNALAFVHLLPFLRKFLSLFFGTSFERDQKLQWIVVERNMI